MANHIGLFTIVFEPESVTLEHRYYRVDDSDDNPIAFCRDMRTAALVCHSMNITKALSNLSRGLPPLPLDDAMKEMIALIQERKKHG